MRTVRRACLNYYREAAEERAEIRTLSKMRRKGKMSKTKIQWAQNADGSPGQTWNPVRGCSRISEGCRFCYAERHAARFCGAGETDQSGEVILSAGPFHGFAQRTPSGPRWTGKVELIEHMLDVPLRTRKPTTWFVNSMSDLFHEALPFEAIDRIFAVMARCQRHTFQILTKRADRMHQYVGRFKSDGQGWVTPGGVDGYLSNCPLDAKSWPMPNVWLGVSVEDQHRADERIPHLLQTPAAVRFISAEPLLGPLGLAQHFPHVHGMRNDKFWVIVGGESGPGARPMDLAWARSIVRQCRTSGVACFVKQLGAHPQEIAYATDVTDQESKRWMRDGWTQLYDAAGSHWRKYLRLKNHKGGDMAEWPEDLRIREMPA